MSPSFPMVSVIIASYNARPTIRACLDSLQNQCTTHPFEVVLADSSEDGTNILILEEYPWVHLVRLQKRTYPGPARNAAVAGSRGTILAFVDTDCTVPSDWIDRIVVAHCTGRTVVGGAILNGTPRSYVGTAEHLAEFSEFLPCQRSRDCRVIPTCNLSVRRDTFDAAGGFEPVSTTELFKAEDTLLCYRLRELGHTIWFDPKIKVCHHNRTIIRHFLNNQLSLGFSSAIVRRLVNTTGSILLRSVFLRTIIPLIKTVILIRRFIHYGFVNLLQLLPYLPLIFLGSCYYAVGFSRGAKALVGITKDSIPQGSSK